MPTLSVVLPTYNSSAWLPATLEHLRLAIHEAEWDDVEIVVVDDGSTDDTPDVLAADQGVPRLTVVRQSNGGRFRARSAGLSAATGEYVVFIDSRVHAHPRSLWFLRQQLVEHPQRMVWNGHVVTADGASVFSRFWDSITFVAWRRYLASPRLVSYGIDEYDHFPKGTTFFAAPRSWLVEACQSFESSFDDLRHANDDTLLIRPIAARTDIFMSPDFSCTYFPRDSARKFLSHSFHRGTVFVDGYYRPGTRFYRPLQVFALFVPLALVLAARRPRGAARVAVVATLSLGAAASVAGVPRRNALALTALAPLFGLAYGAGIIRGLFLRILSRGEAMIALIYGTTAELIKLAPIHRLLSECGNPPLLWCTAQQLDELPEATRLLALPQPDMMLARGAHGHSLRTTRDAARWLASVLGSSVMRRRQLVAALRADGRPPCVLVHGDTMTTVLGALLGRSLRARVGHVEAGLRSHDWRNPFPEELDRRIVGHIAHIHYAPSEVEAANVERTRGDVVITGGNTVRDSVQMVPDDVDPGIGELPDDFGLVSLHRIELLQDDRFAATLRALRASSVTRPLVMVYDPVTDEQIDRQGLAELFDDRRFRRIPKLPYFRFVSLLRRAAFVVTDSGGLQEECAFIGKPCLVHRVKSERSDGLGTNARLSGMDVGELERFLRAPDELAVDAQMVTHSPSASIVDDLVARGFVVG